MKRAVALFAVLALPLSACAGAEEPADDATELGVDGEDTEASASDEALTSGRYHFNVINPSATWNPGCGQPRPDGTPCPYGLYFTYTKNYIDLTFTQQVSVNNRTYVITIKTDTWSNSTNHSRAPVSPQTIKLNPRGLQMFESYTVVTTNYKGRVLARNQIFTALAP